MKETWDEDERASWKWALLFVQSINGSINDNMHMDDKHRGAEIEKGEDGDFCPLKQET